MKITDYPRTTSLEPDNVHLIDGPNGTQGILNHDLFAPEMHRIMFRGKNLGGSVTSEQQASIRDGSFKDLFLGDHWIIGGVTWRIVDIDYWMHVGDTEANKVTAHHLVMMPDDTLYAAVMNDTAITTGGYIGSQMHTTNLAPARTTINAAFPGLVITRRGSFDTAVTNGIPSAGAWSNSTAALPSEMNVYGCNVFRPTSDGVTIPFNNSTDRTQFALFSIAPKFLTTSPIRHTWWLRDPASATNFSAVSEYGRSFTSAANYVSSSSIYGPRPVFAIG